MSAPTSPRSQSLDAWSRFVLRHQKPGNLAFHFVSMLCFYASPLWALVTGNPWHLGLFFASGLIGGLGHYLFDDGRVDWRELTSRPEVPSYVVIMFWRIVRGRYAEDTRLARELALRAAAV